MAESSPGAFDAILKAAYEAEAAAQRRAAQDRMNAVPEAQQQKELESELTRFRTLVVSTPHGVPPAVVNEIAPVLFDVALRHGISPVLLWSIMFQESRGKPDAVNPKGAYGLMQIFHKYETAWFSRVGDNWKDPRTNITRGAEILAEKYEYFRMRGTANVARLARRFLGIRDPQVLASLKDPRPLAGYALTEAAVAAYNAGQGRVLAALAAQRSADAVTERQYAAAVLTRTADKARVLAQKGSRLGSLENALAAVVGSPVAVDPVGRVFERAYEGLRASARASAMVASTREQLYGESAAQKTRASVVAQTKANAVEETVSAAAEKNPGFIEDDNLRHSSYDYEKGLWGDGSMT